jgi:predicted ATP-grasp superfamily ATP-dependent carboligase
MVRAMLEWMEHVTFVERPTLRSPVVVCAFRGWNDGGEAATVAVRFLIERWQARPLAYLDPEEFYDFQVTRPTVRLEGGVSRVIEWPRGEFHLAAPGGRDVILFTATEPNNRWRTFAGQIIGTAKELGAEMLLTLGAFLTDVPHSRDVPVVGSSYSEETAATLGLARSQYEGPTGVVGVLHDASNRSGLPSVSLWAATPHYLPAGPNPKAALALVERVGQLLDADVDTSSLSEAVARWEEGVSRLLAGSEELAEYVSRLEAASDEAASEIGHDVTPPSGETLAAEVERFLRDQERGSP